MEADQSRKQQSTANGTCKQARTHPEATAPSEWLRLRIFVTCLKLDRATLLSLIAVNVDVAEDLAGQMPDLPCLWVVVTGPVATVPQC